MKVESKNFITEYNVQVTRVNVASMAYRVDGENVNPCRAFKRRVKLEKGVP